MSREQVERERGPAGPSAWPSGEQSPERTPRTASFLSTFSLVLAVLLVVRGLAPLGVQRYVNATFGGGEGTRVRIGDVDLNLWRGAYEVEDLRILRAGESAQDPALLAPRLDLSVRWSALLRGQLVGEAVLHRPVVRLGAASAGGDQQAHRSWVERVAELTPFRLERFVIRDGELRYVDRTTEPVVDLSMTDVYLEAEGFSNAADAGDRMATLEAAGRPLGTGELELLLRLDPLARRPEFELDLAVRAIELIELNDWFQAYAGVDAEAGTLELYSEFAVTNGRIEGYVKPLLEGVRVFSFEEIDDPGDALEALWEGLIATGAEVLENQPHDRLALRLPYSGEWGEADGDVWDAALSLLGNAFVDALRPAVDGSPGIEDVARAPAGGAGS